MKLNQCLIYCLIILTATESFSQSAAIQFGQVVPLESLISTSKSSAIPLQWINVNTAPDTWKTKGTELVCMGHPIGVMRSEKQYENFILHIEWMHV
jgi:hypothetical protein